MCFFSLGQTAYPFYSSKTNTFIIINNNNIIKTFINIIIIVITIISIISVLVVQVPGHASGRSDDRGGAVRVRSGSTPSRRGG